jgi:predicted DNA-binding protein YlxM (UPF0122 family)
MTPQTDLVKIEQFQGIPVRIIMHEGRAMMPLNDIADGVGIDRSSLRKLLKRNEKILEGFVSKVIMTSEAGPRETVCLTRDGVTGILMKMDYTRSKLPKIKDNIIGFQKWAIDTLSKIISGETTAIPTKPPVVPRIDPNTWDIDGLRKGLTVIETVSKKTGCNSKDLQNLQVQLLNAMGMELVGNYLAGCVIPAIEKPSVIYGTKGVLDATGIGERLGLSPKSVNSILEKLGYQFKEETTGIWRLAEKAIAEYMGEEYWTEFKSGHQEWRIRWFPDIMKVMEAAGFVETPEEPNEAAKQEAAKQETPINLSQKPDFVQPAYPPRKIADL